MTAPQQILQEAIRLIDRGWCQGRNAMNAHGHTVDPVESAYACKWCIRGAIWKAAKGFGNVALMKANEAVQNALGKCSIAAWNDAPGRKKHEVISLLRRAIQTFNQAAA